MEIGEDATFTMEGGSITGNTAEYGGGVYVFNGGSFTMFDSARIIGNTATGFGGGTDVGGTDVETSFTMSDSAIITGNTAKNGGGVFIAEYGEFTMNGGTISKNKATSEGGVWVSSMVRSR